ncbi:hypothetical protein ACC853_38495, partial [Rhizobium johnstonii]
YSLAIPAIIATLAISNTDVVIIATVTLLASALGGWFAVIQAARPKFAITHAPGCMLVTDKPM